MTKSILFFLLLLTLINCSQPAKEKYLEKKLFAAFKYKNFNEFKKIIITPEDLENGFSSNLNPLFEKTDNKALVESYTNTYLNDYRNLFNKLIKSGEDLGIVWNNIQFENFLYEIHDPTHGAKANFLNGHINIKMSGKSFFLYGIDAQEYAKGFKISYIRAIKQGVLKKYVDSNNSPEAN